MGSGCCNGGVWNEKERRMAADSCRFMLLYFISSAAPSASCRPIPPVTCAQILSFLSTPYGMQHTHLPCLDWAHAAEGYNKLSGIPPDMQQSTCNKPKPYSNSQRRRHKQNTNQSTQKQTQPKQGPQSRTAPPPPHTHTQDQHRGRFRKTKEEWHSMTWWRYFSVGQFFLPRRTRPKPGGLS